MYLTTKARYALRALCHIAHRGYASAQLIAKQQGIPLRYLEEIISALRRAGLVTGKRGPGGGYQLAKVAGEITIADVFSAIAQEEPAKIEQNVDEFTLTIEQAAENYLQQAAQTQTLEKLIQEMQTKRRQQAASYII